MRACAALMAGVRPARLSSRHRRGAPSKPGRGAVRKRRAVAAMGWGKGQRGRAGEALMAGSGRSNGTGSGRGRRRRSTAALLCRAETEKGERGKKEREEAKVNGICLNFLPKFAW